MKYTQIPADTFKNLELNAGVLVSSFAPGTGEVSASDIIGCTSGGVAFKATPTYVDRGEDLDNVPANTKELRGIDSFDAKMTGTFATITAALAKDLIGAADVTDTTKIVPRSDLKASDFKDIWWVGDYSDVNTGTNAGYMAIHLMNALSTGGFDFKAEDKNKGKYAFEFTGHYSLSSPETVPFELYIKAGSGAA